jgi:hypothetical protein
MTKLSRIDSSSNSLKYSVKTCQLVLVRTKIMIFTEHSRCRKKMISAALELRLDSANTSYQLYPSPATGNLQ